jgi:hypothetical protein
MSGQQEGLAVDQDKKTEGGERHGRGVLNLAYGKDQ